MAQVLLIFGGTKKSRDKKAFQNINIKSPDLLNIQKEDDKKSIGIDKVREAIKFLQEKPFASKHKFVVITQAELLTHDAQNAFLKILEEPPEYADIRLCTKAEKDLLDTVISRCKKFNLNIKQNIEQIDMQGEVGEEGKKDNLNIEFEYNAFNKLDTGEKLDYIETLAKEEKEDIITILENWIQEERNILIKQKNKNTNFIENLIRVKEDLENTNMNTKFLLEYLIING